MLQHILPPDIDDKRNLRLQTNDVVGRVPESDKASTIGQLVMIKKPVDQPLLAIWREPLR